MHILVPQPTHTREVLCDPANSGARARPVTEGISNRKDEQRFTVRSTQVDGPYFNVSVNARDVPSASGYFTNEQRRQYVLTLYDTRVPAAQMGYHRTPPEQGWIAAWDAVQNGPNTSVTLVVRRAVSGASLGGVPAIGLFGASFNCSL